MDLHAWIGLVLLIVSVLLIFGYRLKVRRDRDRPTLRHALFASHLGHRVLFNGGDTVPSRVIRH